MISDLLDRPTPKRPATLRFEGRILYLVDDSALMEAQLFEGHDLALTAELKGKLRDQISTDEITPAYICLFYDETLGDFPYLGLSAANPETSWPVGTRPSGTPSPPDSDTMYTSASDRFQ